MKYLFLLCAILALLAACSVGLPTNPVTPKEDPAPKAAHSDTLHVYMVEPAAQAEGDTLRIYIAE